jgi:hypothetical protein
VKLEPSTFPTEISNAIPEIIWKKKTHGLADVAELTAAMIAQKGFGRKGKCLSYSSKSDP